MTEGRELPQRAPGLHTMKGPDIMPTDTLQTITCDTCQCLWTDEAGATLRHHSDGSHTYKPPTPEPSS